MKQNKAITISIIVAIFSLTLMGCSRSSKEEQANQKMTEIAGTVQAELTMVSALTPSVTPTPLPTATATPKPVTPTLSTPLAGGTPIVSLGTASSGDDAQYDADITIPDGSMVKPGVSFQKTWSVLNSGTTTWSKDYQLIYVDGLQGKEMSVKLNKTVAPGEKAQVSIDFIAPTTLGSYTSWWQMYNASGYRFGEQLSVVFVVGNETPTPTSNAPTSSAATATTQETTLTP